MDYQIIRTTPEIGQIEVLYKQDGQPIAVFAIDVPIVDGAYITGEVLDAEILHRAPTWLVERKQAAVSATGFEQIVAIAQPISANEPETAEQQANKAMWEQAAYEQKLAKALVKFGVLSEDPTTINIANL